MSQAVSLFMLYQFLRRMALPFDRWEAFRLGIIDREGNVLIPSARFTEPAQHKAWTKFDVLVRNIKRLLAKVLGGNTVVGSFAAAYLLLREGEDDLTDMPDEDLRRALEDLIADLEGMDLEALLAAESEAPANSAAGVAGAEAVAQKVFLRRRKCRDAAGRRRPVETPAGGEDNNVRADK